MMPLFRNQLLPVFFCLLALGATAQSARHPQIPAALHKVFAQLAVLDDYSCQVTIRREVPGDTLQFPVDKQQHYISRADFIAWSRSEVMESLICSKGQYRANLQERKVYYTPFDDSTAAALRSTYTDAGFAPAWDSLLLQNCRSVQRKQQGSTQLFTLGFGADMPLRSMRVACAAGAALPQRITCTREEQLGPPEMVRNGKGILVRDQVVTEQFAKGMPPALRAILPQITTLATWLQQTYPGFSLEKI
jgi:hypothetical protein